MLYVAKCKLCDFLMYSKHILNIKEKIADHLTKHDITIVWASEISLKNGELEIITILRIRSPNLEAILLEMLSTKSFWRGYRNRNKLASQIATLFSGMVSGETKPFCKPNRSSQKG